LRGLLDEGDLGMHEFGESALKIVMLTSENIQLLLREGR